MSLKVAVVQANAGPDVFANIESVSADIRAAAKEGATLIQTPENTCRMRAKIEDKMASSWAEREHPAVTAYGALAKELGVTLVIGSISSIRLDNGKLANRTFVFAPDGSIAATYDKIHMFDVDLPNGDTYRESETNQAGDCMVVADAAGIRLGLGICYDMRFPHLFRDMAKAGAQILSIPAAFTVPTGQAHWHVLLRARAIETGCFVLAAAQGGVHEGGRATYGHSLIISPWGQILAEIQGDAAGYVCAELDLSDVDKARAAIPSLRHDRPYTQTR